MTDAELVSKKLALIETYVRELLTMADPSRIQDDLREERFVEHTLQIAVQAALDVASHVASDERWEEPRTNQELFELFARHGWIVRAPRTKCSRRPPQRPCPRRWFTNSSRVARLVSAQ